MGTKALTPLSWLVEGMSLHIRQKWGTRKYSVFLSAARRPLGTNPRANAGRVYWYPIGFFAQYIKSHRPRESTLAFSKRRLCCEVWGCLGRDSHRMYQGWLWTGPRYQKNDFQIGRKFRRFNSLYRTSVLQNHSSIAYHPFQKQPYPCSNLLGPDGDMKHLVKEPRGGTRKPSSLQMVTKHHRLFQCPKFLRELLPR